MADASLGTAVLRTRLDKSGLTAGLNQAKSDTQRFARDSVTAVQGIGAAIGAVAASQGVRAYVRFLTNTASLAQQADASTRLFEKSLGRTNQSLSEGAGLVQRLSDRFGVANTVIQQSATLLLRQGASLDDIDRALTAAGASAAAAGFDISTAFDNVATAVATGRSELLETSGIVTNLGPVTQAYAKSVGKTVDELTQQEIIQARVNAIYKETASEIEDVDEILRGLPKAQADWTRELRTFQESAGGLARDVLVPITEAGTNVLRFINDLPEPVKRAGTAMSGAAIGATALSTGIFAIRTAMSGLSALGLASFGPAGWIILGTTAVAGLVAVLSGNGDSLTASVDEATQALASGQKDSMVGALDEVITKVDGPMRDSLAGLRDDLVQTGEVGVAQAQRIAAALVQAKITDVGTRFLGLDVFGPTPIGDALATGGGLLGNVNLRADILDALENNDLIRAIDLLQDALVAMTEAGFGRGRTQPLIDLIAELGSIPNFQFTPPPSPTPTPTPRPTGNTPTGTPSDPVSVSIDDIRAVNFGRLDDDAYPRTRTGANLRAFLARELGINPFARLPEPVPLDPGVRATFGGVVPLGITPRATVGGAERLIAPDVFARLLLGGPQLQERDLGRLAQAQQEANDAAAEAARLAIAAEQAWRNSVLFAYGQDSRFGTQTALDAYTRQALIQSYGITPDQLAFGDSYQGFRPRESNPDDIERAKAINEEREELREAGEEFKASVISAAASFTRTLVDGIRSGEPGEIVRGAFGFGGTLIGLIPDVGFLGQVAASFLPVIGELLGGDKSKKEEEERRRAAELRRNQVSTLEFNFYFDQTNNFTGDLTSSANQSRLREAGIMSFQQFEQMMRRTVLPRLDGLEAKVAALT